MESSLFGPDDSGTPQPALPKYGRTVQAHVEHVLTEASATIAAVLERIRSPKRITVAEREHFRRQLAGVVSAGETVRIWLDAGALRIDARHDDDEPVPSEVATT